MAIVLAAPLAGHAAHLRVIYAGIDAPFAGPVRSMGALYYGEFYGDTNPYDLGAIYRLDAPAAAGMPWTSALLYYFQGDPDGAGVGAPPTPDGHGNLYGTTYGGGTQTSCDPGRTSGCGTVFELSPPMAGQAVECASCWVEHTLVDLPPAYQHPMAALAIDAAGNLYLPTDGGVVRFSAPAAAGDAWTSTLIFGGLSGYYTNATLGIDAAGNLYGTATAESPSVGPVVYRLSPPAGGGGGVWTSLVLATFPPGTPLSGVTVLAGGAVYLPTASVAGKPSLQCPASACAVFRIDRLAHGQTQPEVQLLHSFAGDPAGTPAGPVAVGRDGSVYGPLATDGESPALGVYELSPPAGGGAPWTETLLYGAATSRTKLAPDGGQLAVSAGGTVYGLAAQNDAGVAFKINP